LLKQGKSLLAAGVRDVSGNFKAGETVDVATQDGSLIAKGLVNYCSDEILLIKGCKSSEITLRLGSSPFDEVIHRDNLVLL
jgi:glutamate 5-kinase